MVSTTSINKIINNIPNSVKNSAFPLEKINLKQFEGIQKGIPVFDSENKLISLDDIAFMTKKLETLDIFRGCNVGCTHCLKNAVSFPENIRSVLFEDLIRFTDGFKSLSERFGFNVLNGNKYLNIIDDSNPTDYSVKGLTGMHSVTEAIKLIYESLKIPVLFVTSGWNQKSKAAQNSAEQIAKEFQQNPQSLKDFEVSINPFSGIMEKSREALKNGEPAKASFLRETYTDRMANVLLTFFNLFKGQNPKGRLIYRHANKFEGNDLVGEYETKKLYFEIYEKLKSALGEKILEAPTLNPESVTKFAMSHLIEPSGRGRRYFPFDYNMSMQSELITEAENFSNLSAQEKREFLKDYSLKCVDINGQIYATFPSINARCENSPIEITVPTDVRLNYLNNKEIPPVFSDIELV